MIGTRAAAGVLLAVAIACAASWHAPAAAHVTVASQYTFNRDVLPILSARCGACHVDGGVSFSLLRYAEAKQQAWPIRQALMSGRMPPWPADAAPVQFAGAHTLSAREFNILMIWSAGGTPEGRTAAPRLPVPAKTWPLGVPDVTLPMPEPFTLDAAAEQADHEVTLVSPQLRGKWIRAADLMPGSRAIVHRAEVSIESSSGAQTVALWLPGGPPQPLAPDAAFRVGEDGAITLRIHYSRPASAGPAAPVTDRSRVGVYFSAAPAPRLVRTIELHGEGDYPLGTTRTFSTTVDRPVRLLALRPVSGPLDAAIRVTVTGPDGALVSTVVLQLRPGWPRRYVFETPVTLPAGARIDARVTASRGVEWMGLTGDLPVGPIEGGPLRLAFDVID